MGVPYVQSAIRNLTRDNEMLSIKILSNKLMKSIAWFHFEYFQLYLFLYWFFSEEVTEKFH